eukprot:7023400-Prymnesium_polylepis.1
MSDRSIVEWRGEVRLLCVVARKALIGPRGVAGRLGTRAYGSRWRCGQRNGWLRILRCVSAEY